MHSLFKPIKFSHDQVVNCKRLYEEALIHIDNNECYIAAKKIKQLLLPFNLSRLVTQLKETLDTSLEKTVANLQLDLAMCYLINEEFQNALENISLTDLTMKDIHSFNLWAKCCLQLGYTQDIKNYHQQFVRGKTTHRFYYFFVAHTALACVQGQHDLDEAKELYNMVLTRCALPAPAYTIALEAKGNHLFQQKDWTGAKEIYEKLLEITNKYKAQYIEKSVLYAALIDICKFREHSYNLYTENILDYFTYSHFSFRDKLVMLEKINYQQVREKKFLAKIYNLLIIHRKQFPYADFYLDADIDFRWRKFAAYITKPDLYARLWSAYKTTYQSDMTIIVQGPTLN